MNRKNLDLAVFAALLAVSAAQAVHYYPLLPEHMATHFGISGRADAFGSKTSFFTIYYIVVGGVAAIFLGFRFAMAKIPAWLISLPNRDYWLAPRRREETARLLGPHLMWYGSATLAFLIGVTQCVFNANLSGRMSLHVSFWAVCGAYLMYTALWIFWLYRRFSRPGPPGGPQGREPH